MLFDIKIYKANNPFSFDFLCFPATNAKPAQGPVSPAGYPGTAGGLTAAPDSQVPEGPFSGKVVRN